jgi:hypothetical protein
LVGDRAVIRHKEKIMRIEYPIVGTRLQEYDGVLCLKVFGRDSTGRKIIFFTNKDADFRVGQVLIVEQKAGAR